MNELPEDLLLPFEREGLGSTSKLHAPVLVNIGVEEASLDHLTAFYRIKGGQRPDRVRAVLFVEGCDPEMGTGNAWVSGNQGDIRFPIEDAWREGARLSVWLQAVYEGDESEWRGSDVYKLNPRPDGNWHPRLDSAREPQA